ncbi:MAG TPA: hypothetical protein PKX40_08315 [Spirochaetota bacterium]|nr:hypothetical protein [Spirochaetota bacterium]
MIVKQLDHMTLFMMALVFIAAHVRLVGKKLRHTGIIQYFLHMLYGVAEPTILRITDFIITKKIIIDTAPGRAFYKLIATLSHYLPHGIILTTRAAGKLLDYIEKTEGPGGARIAVGPCVCQRSLNKWKEPSCKDIVILYGADIYCYLDLGYRIITAAEAKNIVQECRKAGLVHTVDFCMQSGKWAFVICNCDKDICVPVRTYLLTGKFVYPGPEIVAMDQSKCLGEKKCGLCITSCLFGVNTPTGSKPTVDYAACLGCDLCVQTCKGNARRMMRRFLYEHEDIMPPELLL